MIDARILEALKVAGLPVVVAALGVWAASRCSTRRRVLAAGSTVALSWLLVQAAVASWPAVPPRQALDVVAWLVLAAVLLAACDQRRGTPAVAVSLAAAGGWLLATRVPALGPWQRAVWSAGSGAAALLLWWPAWASRSRVSVAPGVLAIVAGGAAGAAWFAHSAKLAEVSGGLAVCLAVVALAGLAHPGDQLARGTALVGGVALGAVFVFGRLFVDVPPLDLGLLALGWVSLHVWRRRHDAGAQGQRRAMVLAALLAAAPVAAALVLGWLRYQTALESNPSY